MGPTGARNEDTLGSEKADATVSELENQLEVLLAEASKHELFVHEVAVAPRSKLRVACE
ncbi:hypothetical protein [Kitasatospora sp. NPDC008115]|uniref:hypothetical protein n=1 Tax=Kitasatospora sp. NPDC008115 TaxID=3364022 RepID=UPI0036EC2676